MILRIVQVVIDRGPNIVTIYGLSDNGTLYELADRFKKPHWVPIVVSPEVRFD
jgi:hypothetical protein